MSHRLIRLLPGRLTPLGSAHPCRSLPSGSIPAGSIQYFCHDTLDVVSVPGYPSAVEIRALPTLTRSYPCRFTFYVVWPAAPFATLTPSCRNVVQRLPRLISFSLDVNSLHTLMTTIDKDNKLVTLINVFTVEPAKQQQLVDLLIHATETSMRHLPGFISANIHRSLDGTKVANYAQWRSVEDFQAMQKNPDAKPHMEQAAALAKFEPGLYEVVDTQSAAPNV
jgi:quinol monooxygenase YgiN